MYFVIATTLANEDVYTLLSYFFYRFSFKQSWNINSRNYLRMKKWGGTCPLAVVVPRSVLPRRHAVTWPRSCVYCSWCVCLQSTEIRVDVRAISAVTTSCVFLCLCAGRNARS